MRKDIKKFLITGVATMLVSWIGLVIFLCTGLYLIHPTIYIMGMVVGLGWTLTALAAHVENRNYNK